MGSIVHKSTNMQSTPDQPAHNLPVPLYRTTMWMPAPTVVPLNCPSGLEHLAQIDQLFIHQHLEPMGMITGWLEIPNRYDLKNTLGQKIYFAAEEDDCFTLNCCIPSVRPFTIKIFNNLDQEVIELRRPCKCCCSCFFWCCNKCTSCLQELEVHAPPGTPIGYIKETCHPCLPKLSIQNEFKEEVLKIAGPCIMCVCCKNTNFEVMSRDGQYSVGRITKHWAGCLRETFTDADNFGVQFPMDLDVKMKAVIIGASILLDYMYFEGERRMSRAAVI
ncbi:phospholipid scramblase 1-like isoform X2 [Hemicordylus capensis]|uniref:phospholipid scramblase 1-like isoform X2 n=2 Tax=Hemicordylus capensis TaxID=884348 RepID=UPI002302B081|nr:phospholipid scramblase 1-like isoform X2 [Hemicordylus capensis]